MNKNIQQPCKMQKKDVHIKLHRISNFKNGTVTEQLVCFKLYGLKQYYISREKMEACAAKYHRKFRHLNITFYKYLFAFSLSF